MGPMIPPDTKDWTWTLRETCPDCGFAAADVAGEQVAGLVTAFTAPWGAVLARPGARTRPSELVWSPLEYGCHVRDVCALFTERLALLRDRDEPTFANWDQDATALERDYATQDPQTVAVALIEAAGTVAGTYAGVTEAGRGRRGIRSNGDEFTVETLGTYHLHDVVHHLHDVGAA